MPDISMINGKKISTQDLYDCLKELGIEKGDIICVHSHLMGFGRPLLKRQDFMKAIVDTLKEAIGKEGTLIMPTFTYSFCNNQIYDLDESSSAVGVLTEYYRNCENVKRTWHPIFSFAIGGYRQEEYLDIGPDAFSLDSVYGKMIRDHGKLVMLGGNYGYTFYYLAEEHVNVEHRYFKIFTGNIAAFGERFKTRVPYFVRDLEMKSDLDEEKLSKFLLDTKCQNQADFAKGTVSVIDCRKMYDEVSNALKRNQKRFL